MNPGLLLVLLAAAVVAIGAARLITQETVTRMLDLAGTVLAGVVLVADIIALH